MTLKHQPSVVLVLMPPNLNVAFGLGREVNRLIRFIAENIVVFAVCSLALQIHRRLDKLILRGASIAIRFNYDAPVTIPFVLVGGK